ncbi:MAG: helix-turn-helix domain-containing protein [Bdellovibrionota bacterium]
MTMELVNRVSPFMTVEECAQYLRMTKPGSTQTLYRWARSGKIPARKHNGKVAFHQGDIDHWSASKTLANKAPSLTPFEQARMRLRSLKTEHTVKSLPRIQKGTG